MFKALREFLFGKPEVKVEEPVAPYKIETPLVIQEPVTEAPKPAKKPVAKKPSNRKPVAKKPTATKKPATNRKPAARTSKKTTS